MTDHAELKRLAEAATAGPWSMCGEADGSQGFEIIQDIWSESGTHTGKDVVVYEWSDESDPLGVIHRVDAEFIAAANPAAVLALIAENERLKSVEYAFGEWIEKTEWVQTSVQASDLGRHRADVLRSRIDNLKAGFKNFHRSLCTRFGYYHDDIDWQRDQVSLEEHIATQFSHVNAENSALRSQVEAVQRGAGQLKAENEALVDAMNQIVRATNLGDEAFGIACLVLGELSADAAKSKDASHG
ncbi:ead/Ea22-like family protein [Pseudomonas sp. ACM7]|uniref:ead/Ea22-like family protein n=1 Tax=Pseudomonas sp. ACM7 TaxID=2052956 RepID=UPI0010128D4C|nr:ead/Ea22-like family protein [Pseudomonas sp. ACM7]QAY93667.1 hypothetical protein CUN63_29350 [Pseudomonas sp. ACM7]